MRFAAASRRCKSQSLASERVRGWRRGSAKGSPPQRSRTQGGRMRSGTLYQLDTHHMVDCAVSPMSGRRGVRIAALVQQRGTARRDGCVFVCVWVGVWCAARCAYTTGSVLGGKRWTMPTGTFPGRVQQTRIVEPVGGARLSVRSRPLGLSVFAKRAFLFRDMGPPCTLASIRFGLGVRRTSTSRKGGGGAGGRGY